MFKFETDLKIPESHVENHAEEIKNYFEGNEISD